VFKAQNPSSRVLTEGNGPAAWHEALRVGDVRLIY
jgi:hypothetical protein